MLLLPRRKRFITPSQALYGVAAPTWVPDTPSGLMYDWRAGVGMTLSGSEVTQWTDAKSSFALQDIIANPVYSATGFNGSKPGIQFDGGNMSFGITDQSFPFPSTSTFSFVLLLTPTNGYASETAGNGVFSIQTSFGGHDWQNPSVSLSLGAGSGFQLYSDGDIGGAPSIHYAAGTPIAIAFTGDGSTGKSYNNFTLNDSGAFTSSIGGSSNNFSIGCRYDIAPSNHANFELAYFFIYNTAIDSHMASFKTWTNTNWGTSF